MFTKEKYTLPSSDGIHTLCGAAYIPRAEIRMLLCISHGMIEHIGRYDAFMQYLAQNGILAFGHDHIGHGLSVCEGEMPGHLPRKTGLDTLVNDVLADLAMWKQKYPELPLVLLGHSMGSFIARLAAARDKTALCDGLIVMGTGALNPLAVPGLLIEGLIAKCFGETHISKFADDLAFGSYNDRFEKRTSNDWLSRDASIIDIKEADPLANYKFTIAGMYTVTRLNKESNAKKTFEDTRKDIPLLVISGAEDPVGDYGKGVKAVYEGYRAAGVKDTACIMYDGARHEVLNEINREEVYADLLAWLFEHIK